MISMGFVFNNGFGESSLNIKVNDQIASQQSIGFLQKTRPEQQYNFIFNWKRFISPVTDFFIGGGFSILKIKSTMSFEGLVGDFNYVPETVMQNLYQLGGVVSIGGESFITQHSAIQASVNYYMYATKKLKDFYPTQGANGEPGTQPDGLTKRKIAIAIPAITIDYSYYF